VTWSFMVLQAWQSPSNLNLPRASIDLGAEHVVQISKLMGFLG